MTRSDGSVLDRSRPPALGRPEAFRFPTFSHERREDGLRLLMAPVPGARLATVRLLLPAGAQYQPLERPGLASLTAEVLDEGTRRRSALEVAGAIEELGGRLDSGADWDVGWITADFLGSHQVEAVSLLCEVAREASFPQAEVERVRSERLTDLSRRHDRTSTVADDALLAAIYGDTVYARPLVGTPTAVADLGREEMVGFYRSHAAPGASALVAAGEIEPAELADAAAEAFGAEARETMPPPAPPVEPAPLTGIRVVVVDRPEAAQTELRLGHPGIARGHPDFLAARVLNLLLGGKFTSRINLNLRERHHITYGARTSFSARRARGPFTVAAAVDTSAVGLAVREVLSELRRLQDEPASSEEVEDAKSYLLGVMPYSLQTVGGVAAHLEQLAVHELPDDYYDRLPGEVRAVSSEDLLEVARRVLSPERIVVVAAGPSRELAPQLAELGETEVRTTPLD